MKYIKKKLPFLPPKLEEYGCLPPKRMSSFLVFRQEQLEHVRAKLQAEEANANINFKKTHLSSSFVDQTKMTTIIAEMWKNLPKGAQAKYYEKARQMAEEHQEYRRKWKDGDQYKAFCVAQKEYEEKRIRYLREMHNVNEEYGPKRPPKGGYFNFVADREKRVELDKIYDFGNKPSREVARIMGSIWRELQPEEREVYERLSEERNKDYEQKLAEYRIKQLQGLTKQPEFELAPTPPRPYNKKKPILTPEELEREQRLREEFERRERHQRRLERHERHREERARRRAAMIAAAELNSNDFNTGITPPLSPGQLSSKPSNTPIDPNILAYHHKSSIKREASEISVDPSISSSKSSIAPEISDISLDLSTASSHHISSKQITKDEAPKISDISLDLSTVSHISSKQITKDDPYLLYHQKRYEERIRRHQERKIRHEERKRRHEEKKLRLGLSSLSKEALAQHDAQHNSTHGTGIIKIEGSSALDSKPAVPQVIKRTLSPEVAVVTNTSPGNQTPKYKDSKHPNKLKMNVPKARRGKAYDVIAPNPIGIDLSEYQEDDDEEEEKDEEPTSELVDPPGVESFMKKFNWRKTQSDQVQMQQQLLHKQLLKEQHKHILQQQKDYLQSVREAHKIEKTQQRHEVVRQKLLWQQQNDGFALTHPSRKRAIEEQIEIIEPRKRRKKPGEARDAMEAAQIARAFQPIQNQKLTKNNNTNLGQSISHELSDYGIMAGMTPFQDVGSESPLGDEFMNPSSFGCLQSPGPGTAMEFEMDAFFSEPAAPKLPQQTNTKQISNPTQRTNDNPIKFTFSTGSTQKKTGGNVAQVIKSPKIKFPSVFGAYEEDDAEMGPEAVEVLA